MVYIVLYQDEHRSSIKMLLSNKAVENCKNIHKEGSDAGYDVAGGSTTTGMWTDYAMRTTLHGVRHIVNSETRRCQRYGHVFLIVVLRPIVSMGEKRTR